MKTFSFIQNGLGLASVEVEVSLAPGLPQFKFLGGADSLIKESEARIKQALRAQGFTFPRAQQILVQLRPSDVRKHSRGLDLAVAAAYLMASGQLPELSHEELEGGLASSGSTSASNSGLVVPVYLYGELTLQGEVLDPSDSEELELMDLEGPLISAHRGIRVQKLADLVEAFSSMAVANAATSTVDLRTRGLPVTDESSTLRIQRPSLPNWKFSEEQGRIAMVAALGGHSTLLAGPAGSGKSTLAEAIYYLRPDPTLSIFKESQRIARNFGEKLAWRPLRRPHHTSSVRSVVGGGLPPEPGEITRAHGGVLILDEFLQFPTEAQEALREPIESKKIQLSRVGNGIVFPADSLVVATTNLCRCGALTPDNIDACSCRNIHRRQIVERLSGPMLDRFALIGLTNAWIGAKRAITLADLRKQVERGEAFRTLRVQESPLRHEAEVSNTAFEDWEPQARKALEDLPVSLRRQKFLAQVARTLADLDQSHLVRGDHATTARDLSSIPAWKIAVNLRGLI